MRNSIPYGVAQRDESLRQEYLDNYLGANPSPHVSGLQYFPAINDLERLIAVRHPACHEPIADELRKVNDSGSIASGIHICLDCFGDGRKKPVFVFPNYFIHTADVADAVIRFHEYVHAEDFRDGFTFEGGSVGRRNVRSLHLKVLKRVCELRAHAGELLQIGPESIPMGAMEFSYTYFWLNTFMTRLLPWGRQKLEFDVIRSQLHAYRYQFDELASPMLTGLRRQAYDDASSFKL